MGNVELERIPLFARLAAEDRARAASVARQLKWDVGHVVVREREFAFDFYAVKHGTVEVQREGQRLAVLGAGDFFGELGVVPDDASRWSRRRNASVVVTAPTEAVAIPGSEMRRLAEEIPALRDALRRAAAERSQTETA
jgi:CRP-like cAMP-binding protein